MNGNNRKDIKLGSNVIIVEKQNQRNGTLTEGVILRILTNSQNHPHGIKVMLEDGTVGRVKEIKI
ncbi:MAG: YwbE family protein [Firmicutes bacterium]|nr:YwbE family protein [Bacillota bacterium]